MTAAQQQQQQQPPAAPPMAGATLGACVASKQFRFLALFAAVREAEGTLVVQYKHPVSAFQAFCISLSLVHHAQHQQRAQQPASPTSTGTYGSFT